MAIRTSGLRAIAPIAVAVSGYLRHVTLEFDPPDPFFVRADDGRWSTRWTLYTAVSQRVVWAEYCRNAAADIRKADPTGGVGLNSANLEAFAHEPVGVPLPARALYRLDFEFGALVDLTTQASQQTLSRAGFSLDDLFADDYGGCPTVAQCGDELGWEAVLAPSAAWQHSGGLCLAVFRRGHDHCLRGVERIADAARPTIAIAAATTYRQDERPSWLG